MIDKNTFLHKEFKDLEKLVANNKASLAKLNYGYEKKSMSKYGYEERTYYDKNGNKYFEDTQRQVSDLAGSIRFAKRMALNAQKVQIYIENLNTIYDSNPGQHGVYCNGKDLFIDKEKLNQYNETQQKVIMFISMIFPLLGLYGMAPKGYYGQAGEYEKATAILMCKHLGLVNERPRYAISTRISGNKTIEGLDIKLPPIELRNEVLLNLLNTPNPFFEILINENIPGTNKKILFVKQHFLRLTQGSHFHTDTREITFCMDGNTIIDKKDNQVQQYLAKRIFNMIENPPYKYFKIIFAETLVGDNNKYFVHLMKKGANPYLDKPDYMVLMDGHKIISMDKKHPEIQNHLSYKLFQTINDPSQKYFEIENNEPLFTNENKRVITLKVKDYCPYLDFHEATLFMDNKEMLTNKDKDVSDYIIAKNVMNALCG